MNYRIKKTLTVNFPLLLIIVSTFLQCGGCEDSTSFIPLSEDFKTYTDFPEGSWWVYENVSDPNQKDSIYVMNRTMTINQNYREKTESEFYKFDYVKSNGNIKDTLKYLMYLSPVVDVSNPFFFYELIIEKKGIFGLDVLFHPNEIGGIVGVNECGVHIADKQDTTFMRKQLYFDTITTKFPDQGGCESPNYYISSETYARDVGVICRTYFDGSIYELVDYHINW
ncbi:MAG: hypothetical protein OEW67_01730 [Cyclobacteriaceae bacterium]|nr:hypothetical protein [Cyclobacteriaceae bacterium]